MSHAKQNFVSQASLNTSALLGFSGKFAPFSTSSKPNTMKISFPQFLALEEDEIAQAEEIFRHFDFGNNGRVKTSDLPDILRLLEYNIGKQEAAELIYEIDKKNKGFFTLRDLISLLTITGFKRDERDELLTSLQELDDDGDGYISRQDLEGILTTIGEALDKEELQCLMELAIEPDAANPDQIKL